LHFNDISATTGLIPQGTQCACAGDKLTYNCSVVGAGSTVWRGTVFDCPPARSEITLRHSQFTSNQAFGICNNGDIEGRGLYVVNNCYTSQLNVTVREEFNNKTVRCVQNSNQGSNQVGQSLIRIASGILILCSIMYPFLIIINTTATNLYPPPNDINLTDIQPGTLTFKWTSVISNCSTLQYSIASTSNCGTCTVNENITATTVTATCSDLPLTINAVMCLFGVSTDACGLVGNPSSPLALTLKGELKIMLSTYKLITIMYYFLLVPNVPLVKIIPSYLESNYQALQKLFIVTTMNQTASDIA
jgi:hypothetical protein